MSKDCKTKRSRLTAPLHQTTPQVRTVEKENEIQQQYEFAEAGADQIVQGGNGMGVTNIKEVTEGLEMVIEKQKVKLVTVIEMERVMVPEPHKKIKYIKCDMEYWDKKGKVNLMKHQQKGM